MNTITFLMVSLVAFCAMVPISILVEKLRKVPTRPEKLSWAEDIEISYIDIDGINLRYLSCGEGPVLLLLHTLRTQLDIFQLMIPELRKSFTVYALDYPGHGWSDIPETDYTADYFVDCVEKFMHRMEFNDVLIAGVSIGASIPLIAAGRGNKRIKGVLSINPYDYPGRGAARGNLLANLIFSAAYIPVLGETFMRLRNRQVEKIIMRGGVADPATLPADFLEEIFIAGERPGHYRSFINLIRHSASFSKAHNAYKNITIPVKIIYGEKDWAREGEREKTATSMVSATAETIRDAGHFMPLEQPVLLVNRIKNFFREL